MKENVLRAFSVLVVCLAIAAGLIAVTHSESSHIFGYSTIVICVVLAFVIQWIVFIPSYLKQTERLYDITGSCTFVLVIGVALYSVSPTTAYQWILAAMVVIWALRLGTFLFLRIHKDGKDDRFDEIKLNKYRFFVTWTIQGLWVLITSGAAVSAIISTNRPQVGWITAVGLSLWTIGFMIEVVADIQKRRFKQKVNNEQPFISTGLWSYSRHPNYFGEILLWIGVAIVAIPALSGWQYAVLISPLFVILLLTKVSGVPLLEDKADKKWAANKAYQDYKNRTPPLIPKVF
ncbi:MAG: steroid 5-alpha reductase family enzyme [Alphaproteobacteria bacterium]